MQLPQGRQDAKLNALPQQLTEGILNDLDLYRDYGFTADEVTRASIDTLE
ncbi:MAG: hypothetical protein IBJ03_02180 [Gemmatimonadaceae bacterium]|nr:hypothetical protein [Gemmatimonadaceae bacterium]